MRTIKNFIVRIGLQRPLKLLFLEKKTVHFILIPPAIAHIYVFHIHLILRIFPQRA